MDEVAIENEEKKQETDELISLSELKEHLSDTDPMILSRSLDRFSGEEILELFTETDQKDVAKVLEYLPDIQAAKLLSILPVDTSAAILNHIQSDNQADYLGHLPEGICDQILSLMDPEEAADARELIQFPPDSVGSIMVKEFISYKPHHTARSITRVLKVRIKHFSDNEALYVYVTDKDDKLVGILRMRNLLLANANTKLEEIMINNPISVGASDTLEEAKSIFAKYNFLAIPVIDSTGKMVGVCRRSDFEESETEIAERTFLQSQGIVGGEELRSMPILTRSYRRLSWLSANILLNVLAASIIAMYQETLEAAITLAVFLPIISDMSGCSGNQAVAVSIRELSLGLINPEDSKIVWLKETAVGVINGLTLGLLVAAAAYIWKGNPYLGMIVGGSLALNTIIAVTIGGLLPLFIKKLGKDPAIASGPILTTVTDMCGFFIMLSLASVFLGNL